MHFTYFPEMSRTPRNRLLTKFIEIFSLFILFLMDSSQFVNQFNIILSSYGETLIHEMAQHYNFDPCDAINIFIKSNKLSSHQNVKQDVKQDVEQDVKQVVETNVETYVETHVETDVENDVETDVKQDTSEKESRENTSQSSNDISEQNIITTPKSNFILPWNGESNDDCCQGLKNNYGLFTQCKKPKHANTQFCKQCVAAIDSNDDCHPCGTVKDRKAVGLYEYIDPKGKKVVHYTHYMKRFQITQHDVTSFANSLNIYIDPIHFTPPNTRRGRPSTKKINDTKRPPGRPKKINNLEPTPQDIIHQILSHPHKISSYTHNNLHEHNTHSNIRIPTTPNTPIHTLS